MIWSCNLAQTPALPDGSTLGEGTSHCTVLRHPEAPHVVSQEQLDPVWPYSQAALNTPLWRMPSSWKPSPPHTVPFITHTCWRSGFRLPRSLPGRGHTVTFVSWAGPGLWPAGPVPLNGAPVIASQVLGMLLYTSALTSKTRGLHVDVTRSEVCTVTEGNCPDAKHLCS